MGFRKSPGGVALFEATYLGFRTFSPFRAVRISVGRKLRKLGELGKTARDGLKLRNPRQVVPEGQRRLGTITSHITTSLEEASHHKT